MATPAAPRDPQVQTAQGRLGPFAYTDEGTGPVLVAIHGLPGSARDFRWLAGALPLTVRLLRLDLPAFGGTPRASGPGPGIDARGAFVAEALEVLGVERCVLIGHSMGGGVALSAAVQAPGRVAALGLLSSIGLRPHQLLRRFVGKRLAARAVDWPGVSAPTVALASLLFRQLGFPPQDNPDAMPHTLRVAAAVDFEVQARNTARLAVPTLHAWAEDDTFIERTVFEEHVAQLPAGPRLSWPTGGHNIQKSHAVELAEALVALAQG